MRPQSEAADTSLLTIRGAVATWAIPSRAVSAVEPVAVEETALDALTLLGLGDTESTQVARVLVLEHAGQKARLLVHGALELSRAGPGELLPLPDALSSVTPLISHVALVNGKPTLLVVSPERLLARAGAAASAVSLRAEGVASR
jgi:hypothetical protein